MSIIFYLEVCVPIARYKVKLPLLQLTLKRLFCIKTILNAFPLWYQPYFQVVLYKSPLSFEKPWPTVPSSGHLQNNSHVNAGPNSKPSKTHLPLFSSASFLRLCQQNNQPSNDQSKSRLMWLEQGEEGEQRIYILKSITQIETETPTSVFPRQAWEVSLGSETPGLNSKSSVFNTFSRTPPAWTPGSSQSPWRCPGTGRTTPGFKPSTFGLFLLEIRYAEC